ncbi:N-acetylmuramoyl-L-alanine amidase [Paenibacillus sp. TRM 82003]|nr:N-acetylmuramoyl-L-alanine amidase [Paenibacillus sp. TRM 82003]
MTTSTSLQTTVFEGVTFVDIRHLLPVNPAYTWAELAGVRPITALSTIVCHHDAISKAASAKYSDIVLAQRIAQAHIDSKKHHAKGDPGFPYDRWIRNGIVYITNDIEPREYGVGNNNGYTVNICVSGRYDNVDSLTDADRKALYAAVVKMQEDLPEDRYLRGHGEIVPTACPGYDMDVVRAGVVNLQNEIAYRKSAEYMRSQAYAVANNFQFLYNMANGKDQYGKPVSKEGQDWAVKKLLELLPAVKAAGLLE